MIDDRDVVFVDFDDIVGKDQPGTEQHLPRDAIIPHNEADDSGFLIDEDNLDLSLFRDDEEFINMSGFADYDEQNKSNKKTQPDGPTTSGGIIKTSKRKAADAQQKISKRSKASPSDAAITSTAALAAANNHGSDSVVLPPTQPFIMSRGQFYRMRPKPPRISKTDPRRAYAGAFAAAYNSSDFDEIWAFVNTYCTQDILFVTRWVGSELYVNFPRYLEVRGIESVSEYWFSRCIIVPDYILELKETKLFVRSDGISTVLTSFTILATRLYDGEISDAIICQPATDVLPIATTSKSESQAAEPTKVEEGIVPHEPTPEDIERADRIYNRVFDKLKSILVQQTKLDKQTQKSGTVSQDNRVDLFAKDGNKETTVPEPSSGRKRLPSNKSITLYGTATLHLNVDHKIHQMDLTFSLEE